MTNLGATTTDSVSSMEAAGERRFELRLLAKTGAALAGCMDVPSTVAALLAVAVPDLADAAVVELVGAAAAHGELQEYAADGRRGLLVDWRDRWSIDRFAMEPDAAIPAHVDPLGTGVSIPLAARGEVLGAVVLLREAGRPFRAVELEVAREIARRAALSIDGALRYEQAQAANRAKDEFLGIVSHELRTPLNAILGWTSILARDLESRQTLEHGLRIIERNARIQAKLIDDILDVSRIISGKLRIEQRGVDLCSVIRAGVESVKNQAEAKGIEIGVEIVDAPCLALGDPERLQQVLWNLLTNAVKFTHKAGHVWVRLSRQRNAFVIAVKDDGKGIDRSLLPHVFERFRQGDSSPRRSHGGLGLGLAIARHLVEAHGGSIEATSDGSGAGSLFTVRLPIPALLAIEEMVDAGSTPLLPIEPEAPRSLHGRRLLVVEDEPDARELVVVALRSAGAEVSAYGTAADAYRAITHGEPPDVVISDIGLPGEDGYELIRKVRLLEGLRGRLPAIALTAYTRPEDARQVFMAGFHVHLPKPVDAGLLAAAVANLLG